MKKMTLIFVLLLNISFKNSQSEDVNKYKILSDSVSVNKEKQDEQDSYAENVHMYICIEAFKLLKDRYPNVDLSVLENRIGTMSDFGTRHWQVGSITNGAYREDAEDVVFDIRGPFGFYRSNSHFLDCDNRTNGDHSLTTLNILGFNTDYPNAYTRVCRYLDGQWFSWSNGGYHERRYIEYNHGNGYFYRFSYHPRGFIDFVKTKRIWYHSYINTLGQEIIVNEEITLSDQIHKIIVFEVLGGIAHNLQDVNVPAHSRNDVHVRAWDGGDCYHSIMDDGRYLQYNWQTAKAAGGLVNPYEVGADPLRYLMFVSAQLANHFPSGPDCLEIPQQHLGNNNLPGSNYPILHQYFQELGPPPPNIPNVNHVADYCFNHAIRATAGLYYWFAVETGMIDPDPGAYPVINGFSYNLPNNIIYRGETLKLTCNASGSNLNYSWFYKVCNVNNWCVIPINGVNFTQNGNQYLIKNNSFSNNWTCSYYDSICNNSVMNNSAAEPPVKIFLGVNVSNQFGQVSEYYNMNNPVPVNLFNGIRPPDPPISGCPVIFTLDSNGFNCVNNALNKSTFHENEGKDISDKLVIENTPFVDTSDNTIQFAVIEKSGDHNYLDNFTLTEVIHHKNYSVAVTENNDIVLIDLKNVRSPVYAEKNGVDVTMDLAYDSSFQEPLKGEENEIIFARYVSAGDNKRSKIFIDGNHFASNDPGSYIGLKADSVALILDPSEPDMPPGTPVYKRVAGNLSVTDTAGIKNNDEIDFSRRQRRSLRVIPVLTNNEVSEISMTFKQGFNFILFRCC